MTAQSTGWDEAVMDIIYARDERNNALVELFRQTFTDSEGAEEGDFIADLVAALFKQARSQTGRPAAQPARGDRARYR